MAIRRTSGAPFGNSFGTKLKDPLLRQKAYKQFCAHIAKGKSKDSFYFIDGDFKCTWKTIQSYAKESPHEFPTIEREVAYAQGYGEWEAVCEESAKGENKDANTASLNMVMRNKFAWDKPEQQNSAVDSAIIDKFLDRLDVALGVSKKDSD